MRFDPLARGAVTSFGGEPNEHSYGSLLRLFSLVAPLLCLSSAVPE
jgi:hypothetical protein